MTSKRTVPALPRRDFLKATGMAGLAAALPAGLARTARADPVNNVEYYFDTVNGDDGNDGSISAPWRGVAPTRRLKYLLDLSENGENVTLNLARGSVFDRAYAFGLAHGPGLRAKGITDLTIRAYGDTNAPLPRIDCLDVIRAGTTDIRATDDPAQGWTRLGSSQVWRLPLWPLAGTLRHNLKVQRLWVGSGRTEFEDLPIRIITGDTAGACPLSTPGTNYDTVVPDELDIVAALTGDVDVMMGGDYWDTHWYAGPSSYDEGQPNRKVYLYLFSPLPISGIPENPVASYGEITLSREDYGYYGLQLIDCPNFTIQDIEIWGGNTYWARIDGGSGTLRRLHGRHGNVVGSGGIGIFGKTHAGGAYELHDLCLSNDLVNARFFTDGDGDASGTRGTNDLIYIEGTIDSVLVKNGHIRDAIHAGISCPEVTPGNDFTLEIDGTRFYQDNVRYGRALNINGQANSFQSVSIHNIVVTGQPTGSQISGENIGMSHCKFSDGRPPVGFARKKYSGVCRDKRGTGNQLTISNLPTIGGTGNDNTRNVQISYCKFFDAYDAPIGYYNYSNDVNAKIHNNVNWHYCVFSNSDFNTDFMIDTNTSAGRPAIQMYFTGCESYGYSKARCWNGSALVDVTFNPPPSPANPLTLTTLRLQDHANLTAPPLL